MQKHTTGSFSLLPYIDGIKIGQHIFTSILPKKYWINNLPGSFILIKYLYKYSIISNIFIYSKYTYSTSNGSFCQILDFFNDFDLIKIILPSKKTILIKSNIFAVLGKNAQTEKKLCVLGKAGYNYIIGKKPKVRGVARNPVDHPHGGRTKTNQPEVSIWGWIAKKNK